MRWYRSFPHKQHLYRFPCGRLLPHSRNWPGQRRGLGVAVGPTFAHLPCWDPSRARSALFWVLLAWSGPRPRGRTGVPVVAVKGLEGRRSG